MSEGFLGQMIVHTGGIGRRKSTIKGKGIYSFPIRRVKDAFIRHGLEVVADALLEAADQRSRGTVTLAQMRADNHPYGKGSTNYRGLARGPIPHGDASIVNEQSGEFRKGWRARVDRVSTNNIRIQLYNVSNKLGFLDRGKGYMIRRKVRSTIMRIGTKRAKGRFRTWVKGKKI